MVPKVPGHVEVYVSGELRSYKYHKARIESYERDREEALHSTPKPDVRVMGGEPSNPTMQRALRLVLLEARYEAAKLTVSAIDSVLAACTDTEKEFMRVRFFENMGKNTPYPWTRDRLMEHLGLAKKDDYYEMHDEIIARVADAMGLWPYGADVPSALEDIEDSA